MFIPTQTTMITNVYLDKSIPKSNRNISNFVIRRLSEVVDRAANKAHGSNL